MTDSCAHRQRQIKIDRLTFLQLVLHHHQEGDAHHEEVEAETDPAESAHGSATHLSDHILIRLLSADRRGVAKDNQATDEEHKGHLQGCRQELSMADGAARSSHHNKLSQKHFIDLTFKTCATESPVRQRNKGAKVQQKGIKVRSSTTRSKSSSPSEFLETSDTHVQYVTASGRRGVKVQDLNWKLH